MVRELLANLMGLGWLYQCLTYGRVHSNLATKWSFCGDRRETDVRDDDALKAAEDDDALKAAEDDDALKAAE
jgi:hypothetical protein